MIGRFHNERAARSRRYGCRRRTEGDRISGNIGGEVLSVNGNFVSHITFRRDNAADADRLVCTLRVGKRYDIRGTHARHRYFYIHISIGMVRKDDVEPVFGRCGNDRSLTVDFNDIILHLF